MHANFKDILSQTEQAVALIVHAPKGAEFKRIREEKFLNDCIKESGFKPSYNIHFLGENEEADAEWTDDLLTYVEADHGLIVVSFLHKTNLRVVAHYSTDEVVKLRKADGVAQRLYVRCMIANDVTEPVAAHTPETVINVSSDTDETRLKPSAEILTELEVLEKSHVVFSTDKLATYLFKGREAPAMMNLIGVARSITFAAIGAGSGKEIDVSEEDAYYDHLLLWDKTANSLVGAYRIGFTDEILKSHGKSGMYLDHVYDIQPKFYEKMGNAMELSRSFVLPKYQKNPQMLDALWKGISCLSTSRKCHVMYGSVTISASFTPLSQAILVDTLDRYYSEKPEFRESVRAKVPFVADTEHHALASDSWASQGFNKLNPLILELEQNQRPIPPLMRYYVSIGAKFLSFQVEESFNDAIYCLLRVDLDNLPARYKKRLFGDKL